MKKPLYSFVPLHLRGSNHPCPATGGEIIKSIFVLFIIAFIFSSCGTIRFNKTSDFSSIENIKNVEGSYLNRMDKTSILSLFNIQEYADFVTITAENSNEIKLSYHTDSIQQEKVFTGKMGKNFFEIYFSKKQLFIPLIYSFFDVDRVRIGKSKDEKLLIRKYENHGGNLLILSGGYTYEDSYKFSYATAYNNFIPIQTNGLWGYADSLGKILIAPKYDFATIFERDIARVKLNNKWGLINKQGEEITPIKYDYISLIDSLQLVYKKLGGMDLPIDNNKTEKLYSPPLFRVSIGGKHGVLDINGNETIPVIYDEIGYLSAEGFTHIRLGDKWGFAIGAKVVIPAIYSEILYSVSPNQETVKRDGKYYIVDKDGYEYETKKRGVAKKGFFFNPDTYLSPILSTKRKIQLDEQKIE